MAEVNGARKPQATWIYFTETRSDLLARRKPLVDREVSAVRELLQPELDLVEIGPVSTREQVRNAAKQARDSDAVILHVPIFVDPSLVALTARLIERPVVLLGNQKPDTSSFVGIMGAGGILDQIGHKHLRICGDLGDATLRAQVVDFCWASRAVVSLQGQSFGAFGGISLGILTGSTDPVEWLRLFGVVVVHFDQLQIVQRAEMVPAEKARETTTWLLDRVGLAEIGDKGLTDKTLDRQVRSYLALKEIIGENKLDFIGIKCQTEMSDGYALQCLSHMMLNDPYDAEGSKLPVIASCETDMDGALTMQILSLLSGGEPACTLDLRRFYEGTLTLANCGGMPSYFAKRSTSPENNLSQVHLLPHVFGKAGGGATQFVSASGPVTMARLQRHQGKYNLVLMEGNFVDRPREALRETTWPWPHAYFEGPFDYELMLSKYSSNHVHAVSGHVGRRVRDFCEQLGIEIVSLVVNDKSFDG